MGKYHTSKKVLTLPPARAEDGIYIFEELADIVQREIEKYRSRWTLRAIAYWDFDDTKSIIFLHVFKKFDKWDQTRSIFPWLHTIIRHQIDNLLRDKYYSFQKPCVNCEAFESLTESCLVFGLPCLECPKYKKWVEGNKQNASNVKLPLSLNDDKNDQVRQSIELLSDDGLNIEFCINKFNGRMEKTLSKVQYKIYKLYYLDGKTEMQIAQEMGYKTTSHSSKYKRSPGYRWIAMVLVEIGKKAKEVLEKYGVE